MNIHAIFYGTAAEVSTNKKQSVISGISRDADDIYALLGHYAASSVNPLPTFRDNVSVPYSSVKKSKRTS
jgi:hypothetical protein